MLSLRAKRSNLKTDNLCQERPSSKPNSLTRSISLRKTYSLLHTSNKESALNINADVTTVRQLYIQGQLATKRLNVALERRDFLIATHLRLMVRQAHHERKIGQLQS